MSIERDDNSRDVCLRNVSAAPIFVQSQNANYILKSPATTVMRLPPGHSMKIFDFQSFLKVTSRRNSWWSWSLLNFNWVPNFKLLVSFYSWSKERKWKVLQVQKRLHWLLMTMAKTATHFAVLINWQRCASYASLSLKDGVQTTLVKK